MKKSSVSFARREIRLSLFGVLFAALIFGFPFDAFSQKGKSKKRTAAKKVFVKKSIGKKSRLNTKKYFGNDNAPRTEGEFEGNAEKREDWFMFQRTFPAGELPPEARRNAWLSRPEEARPENGGVLPQWKSIGPRPTTSYFPNNWNLTSGRINAVAVSPSDSNIVLVGAATGGVWRSTDGGQTFNPTSDNHVDLAVGSIAFAPSNPSIVYAGMGDKASSAYLGTGVLKSSDGGQTWNRISGSTLPSPGRISQILVDPNNANRVYVAQYSRTDTGTNTSFAGGFFYSTDGGVTWTRTIAGLPRDLVRHPTDPNTLYLAMGRYDSTGQPNTGGVWRSTDAGLNWTRIHTSSYTTTSNIKIAVTPAAPQNLYVLSGISTSPVDARLEISTDGGANWTNKGAALDKEQFSYNLYLFVNPANPDVIYIGTRDLWRSNDGGTTYTNLTGNFTLAGGYTPNSSKSHPDQHHLYISSTDPNLMYIANDGGLWKSNDGGSTMQSLNATLGLSMFISLDLHPTNPAITYGGTQDNGTQKRTNGSAWREFATGDGGQTLIDPVDPTIVFTTYVYRTIYRYVNDGNTYSARIGTDAVFANDRTAFYPPFVNNGVDSKLYFGTYRLYISSDRGANWTAPGGATDLTAGGSDLLSAIAVSRSNTNVIYTGSGQGRAMISTDGGTNWTNISAGLPTRFIKSITVSPTDSNTAYLTVSGYGTGHVFKTTNGGANWTDISNNLPNIPVNCFLFDPRDSSTFYVGTDIGVFRSTNAGAMWETFNQGMPPTIVTELDSQSSGLIQAATYGRGMYELSPSRVKPWTDFDGDGKTDISVFRPSDNNWYLMQSTAGFTSSRFGLDTDIMTPGDYDGDGKTDVAVFRAGNWYRLNSSNGAFFSYQFGQSGDKPVQNDYDGDGKTDVAVYRNGAWYLTRSSDSGFVAASFGVATDIPIPADYDGDGKADYAVRRTSSAPDKGDFYVLKSSDSGFSATAWGLSEDIPTVGDFDGDGKADIGVFRPSNGYWYIIKSSGGNIFTLFGMSGDIPVTGDYDGDGRADIAVFRAGNWYLTKSSNNEFFGMLFGNPTDIPIPSKSHP